MSASAEFQKWLVSHLRTDPGLSAMVAGRVYDEIPHHRPELCLAIGPSDFRPIEEDCVIGREETVQVDVFNRAGGRLVGTRRVVDAIVSALNGVSPVLTAPYAAGEVRIEMARVFRDSDGRSSRGVVQVTCMIEGG